MKVVLLMAMTADGMIARHMDHFPDWTGKADKRMFKQVTMDAGVIIMGARTYDAIGRPLPGRLNVVMSRNPERYEPADNLMVTSATPGQILDQLAEKGYQTAILAGGAMVNTLFASEKLIDEMMVTISPLLFGSGLSLFSESLSVDLEWIGSKMLEQGVILLHYRFLWPD